MSPDPVRAKRGDLVVIVQEHRDHVIGTGTVESTTCEIGIVSNVTREGAVKAYRPARYYRTPDAAKPVSLAWLPRATALLIPATTIDVAAAVKAAEAHCWHGDGREFDSYRPFDSLDEVRAALKPCLIPRAAT
jgi:hypothetical protein